MYYLVGTIAIFVIAYIIIKLSINTKENPDSQLGIMDHPSTYKKQDIEMVENTLQADDRNDIQE
ncbi:hypothetical protein C1T31_00720 [Hanstruepera neustonica]|uniref:Uncharacterized protein n=1 Tax=Hanstruepera neustonica TaxID=1445657 RepID=A0A2K1E320_9FLAO|nr:hypothetical protein [Hanstruepera neustonica]PNQ74696.1 hypothetical protein C1T31_00720 [Hanstruepera neustonica]